jgi:hypothetical protein
MIKDSNINIAAIKNAPPIEQVTEHETQDKLSDPMTGRKDPKLDQHLGCVGRFIGGGTEKAGNIAFLTIILFICLLILAFLMKLSDTIIASIIGIIGTALGYVFGSNSNK